MISEQERYNSLLAFEGFLRRAAEHDFPFMLKGSLLTRQYLPEPKVRYANDLDWVYMPMVDDAPTAQEAFSKWTRLVTETDLADGIKYRSFKENDFWRMMDYAMADDFPTVNTDLLCYINGEEYDEVRMDISFNLQLEVKPVPLMYKPLIGPPFLIKYTCPLSLQVAWKLHQTLIRPRYKDIYDLLFLLDHPEFNEATRNECLQALVNECARDKRNTTLMLKELITNPQKLKVHKNELHMATMSVSFIPANLNVVLSQFSKLLAKAGFTPEIADNLPKPTIPLS
ncbi:MAG: hypothetical protein JWO06_2445 [Bacteroidota bacterium]|nr:hypothetical protein [Bacteroidota bacterium]